MKEKLRKLIAFDTTASNSEGISQALDYIANFLNMHGMYAEQFDINGRRSLVASTRKDNHKHPKVMLSAHLDTVHGTPDMLVLRQEGDRLYGRGTADMKFSIAAYMQLVEDLKGKLESYDFGIMITSDEESGGVNGVDALLKRGFIPEVAILPDAGDTPDGWKLERSAKGGMPLRITTTGRVAHGSRPWEGDNAIEKLFKLLEEIKALFPDQSKTTNTYSMNMIEGGKALNQVPAEATAAIDSRFIDDDNFAVIYKKIQNLCDKYGATIQEEFPYGNACYTDFTNPFVSHFLQTFKEALPEQTLTICDSLGQSDARYLAKYKIPTLVVSSAVDGYHRHDEWASEKGMDELLTVLKHYIATVDTVVTTPVDSSK